MEIQKLVDILSELRSASMQIDASTTEEKLRTVMHKYDMLFVGEKFNHIYSVELYHSIKNYFHIDITNDELNILIPIACKGLGMKLEPLVEVSKVGKSTKPDGYEIILW